MILTSPRELDTLLERSGTVALIGASNKPLRPSYTVLRYLREQTRYKVAAINPAIVEIDGVRVYSSLSAYAAQNGPPDIVDIFRRPSDVLDVVAKAIAHSARCVWFQLGVINPEAIELADRAGLDVVVDRCLKIEDERMHAAFSKHS